LDPGGGTLIALGLCHEAEGKTASAWGEFSEALTLAMKDGRVDRATVAREHGEKLEPKLSRLMIRVSPELMGIGGLEILEDGVLLGRAAWGSALPVDPGEHSVQARAPGRKPWTTSVVIGRDADKKAVDVPPLDAIPTAEAPPRPENPEATSSLPSPHPGA